MVSFYSLRSIYYNTIRSFIYGIFDLQKHSDVTWLFTIKLLQLMNDMHNIFAGMFYYYFDFDATHNTHDSTLTNYFSLQFVRSLCHIRKPPHTYERPIRQLIAGTECERFWPGDFYIVLKGRV